MRINGLDLKPFSPLQRRILVSLGLRHPGSATVSEIIEDIYPNPDYEPGYASDIVRTTIYRLRERLVGWRISREYGWGYSLERVER